VLSLFLGLQGQSMLNFLGQLVSTLRVRLGSFRSR
jgi:hypothetical protein